jgi:hypothetical protein
MSVHEKEEISIDELEDALESRNASIMEKWFNQTGPKELGENTVLFRCMLCRRIWFIK